LELHERFIKKLAGKLAESSQMLPGAPIVEITDGRRVLIENHRGVTEYGDKQISVMVRFGKVLVSGDHLELGFMSKQQLVICGCIEGVSIVRCSAL